MKTLLLLWLFLPARADTLSLEVCQRAAWANYPLVGQLDLHEEIADLRREEIRARFLPSLSFGGQAVYHSDVPEFPLSVPGMSLPSVAHDQYRVSLDLSQLLYDGGAAAGHSRLEEASSRLAREQVSAEFQKIREQVNQAYFAALLQDAAIATIRSLQGEVETRRRALEAHVREGIAAAGATEALDVELLRIQQQLWEARVQRDAALAVLETLTGLNMDEDVVLLLPAARDEVPESRDEVPERLSRPEYSVFQASRERLELQKDLTAVEKRPKIAGTAALAYGRPPGLNIFENELSPFYTIGVQVRWPLFRDSGRDLRIIGLQQEILDTQEAAFTQGVQAVAERERHDMQRLEELIETDRKIIALRQRIAERARRQVELAEISATDYLIEEHAEHQARLTYERRRIELEFAKVRYLTTLGLTDDASKATDERDEYPNSRR